MAGQVLGNKVAAKDLTEEVDPPCHSNYQTHKRIKSILLNVCRRLHRLLLDSLATNRGIFQPADEMKSSSPPPPPTQTNNQPVNGYKKWPVFSFPFALSFGPG